MSPFSKLPVILNRKQSKFNQIRRISENSRKLFINSNKRCFPNFNYQRENIKSLMHDETKSSSFCELKTRNRTEDF